MKAQSASNQVFMGFYWWHLGIVIIGAITFYPNSAVAQITPDATLPNNSNVNSVNKTFNINGGSQAGGNLFHSFKDFSVPTGWEAFFNNGADIQNIISRVTGKSISNIDGLIKANGSANLFLMNPSGIVFGKNARLDIGGSFIGTSADSMKFSDGSEFSATNPQSKPLLTINVPMGLQYGTNPGSIQVRGNGQGTRNFDSPIIDTQDALRVEADKTLALVGGDINLEGATLKTAGGRIELGSVGGNSLVNLVLTDKGFFFDYGGVANFGDIKLSQQAIVDASGEGAGDIQVQGKRVTLIDSSRIETSTLGAKPGGDLVVNATELIETIGKSGGLRTYVYLEATGDAGDLNIQTRQLLVKDGAGVNASTFGAGNAGNLTITALDSIQVIGMSADGNSLSGLFAQANSGATGDTGDLNIQTRHLLVRDGGQVGIGTFSAGNAGNFTVTAQKSIEVIGDGKNPTGLFSQTGKNVTGDGGDLNIQTRQLLVRDGGQIGTGTSSAGIGGNFTITANESIQLIGTTADGRNYPSGLFAQSGLEATGDAGNLSIQTRQLSVKDGAAIATNTLGAGKGGNLNVTASKSIEVIGRSADGKVSSGLSAQATIGSGDAGDINIQTPQLLVKDGAQVDAGTFSAGKGGNLNITASEGIQVIGTSADGRVPSRLYTSSEAEATGDAGDLNIATNSLLIKQGRVSVQSLKQGNAGTLNIDANSIRLDNNATITASTESVNKDPNKLQANINVDSQDLILRGNSNFNANAQGENVIGGNINIDNDVLAVLENSRISANSADSRGGRVTINTQGIFGNQPWYTEAFRGYITATGATPNLSGDVQINTQVDPSSGLVELPVNLVNASNQISNACTPGSREFENTFVSTGRGGLPMNPTEPLQGSSNLSTWVKLKPQSENSASTIKPPFKKVSNSLKVAPKNQIIEATGWIVDKDGNIEFVAQANQANPKSPWQTPASCPVSQ